jgi:hypothetical protein
LLTSGLRRKLKNSRYFPKFSEAVKKQIGIIFLKKMLLGAGSNPKTACPENRWCEVRPEALSGVGKGKCKAEGLTCRFRRPFFGSFFGRTKKER